MGDFTKLAVWKKAHEVTLGIYRETSRWPKHELFGLTSQSRRAAVAIPANLAEVAARTATPSSRNTPGRRWGRRASCRTT